MKARKEKAGKSRVVAVAAPKATTTRAIPTEQAGDFQGLSDIEEDDFESIAELAAEGQAFEAEVLEGCRECARPRCHGGQNERTPGGQRSIGISGRQIAALAAQHEMRPRNGWVVRKGDD